MTEMPWETISNARLRNIWISGYVDALQEMIKMLEAEILANQYDDMLAEHWRRVLEMIKDRVNSRLILAQDVRRRIREQA
jgi:hypothetical protein